MGKKKRKKKSRRKKQRIQFSPNDYIKRNK